MVSGKGSQELCYSYRNHPTTSNEPEIIYISDDDVEILSEKSVERVKNVSSEHPVSFKKRILQRYYNKEQRTQKCSVPLIRCDSKNFLPHDFKNSFSIESKDDEEVLRIRKKPSKKLSSESSDEDSVIKHSDISSSDYFDSVSQKFILTKTEDKDPEYYKNLKEIFGNECEGDKNSNFENQDIESIEKITEYLNGSLESYLAESEYKGSGELNQKLKASKFQIPPKENYGFKKSSNSSDKTLLTDPNKEALFNRGEAKPVRGDKTIAKSKNSNGAEKYYTPKIHLANEPKAILPVFPRKVLSMNPIEASMSKEDSQLTFGLSFNGLVKSLLKLKPIWLEEQRKMPDPPPDLIKSVKILPLFFQSFETYATSFYHLLKLEIWQFMFEASKEVLPKRFNFRVLTMKKHTDCIELKCESVLNDKCYFEPREGMMTILELKVNPHQNYHFFGFIFQHEINRLNLNLLHTSWKKTSADYLKDAKHWIFHAWIKQKELLLEPDILKKGNGICYLRNRLRLFDALRCFKDSPLMADIIEPKLPTFALTRSKSSSNSEYTSRQLEIIQAICAEIYKPYLNCKINLIQGPPGTGKTHIIIGILETLFYGGKSNSNLKVLVTAPSNVALDEIGCRLIEVNERYGQSDNPIKFVRVGVGKKVHSKMLPYFIDRKAQEFQEKTVQLPKPIERELKTLRLEIFNIEKEQKSFNSQKKLKNLKERCMFIEDSFFQKNFNNLTDIKRDIIKQSHIVLSTLGSTSLPMFSKTFFIRSELNFSCCIVDEATQCNELEILQPLALGISKLILIGDEKQLPAAHPECMKKYLFDRSMYERLCQYFKSQNLSSPVVFLTEQFRMHPSICEYSLTHMYNMKLEVHPETFLMYKEFPLNPYIILNTALSFHSSIQSGELLIYYICQFLSKVVDDSCSIAIIVPQESQRSLCTMFLNSHSHFNTIEINTIKYFQGREKDIVILYAIDPKFRSTGDSFITCERKMNVALTRAKKCLIICVDSRTLLKYQHWKNLVCEGVEKKNCYTLSSPEDVCTILNSAVKK